MKFSALAILYILHSALAQPGSKGIKPEAVYSLTPESFTSFITFHPLALIDFYTTWCTHCTKLSPKLELAATELQGLELEVPVVVGKVDCTTKRWDRRGIISFCRDMGVRSLPALKIYRDGAFQEEYRGPSTAEGITKFMVEESKRGKGGREKDEI
ncbi:thioredoxin-like protein [Tirmania nivea]|nr:thioredoxin-like protein [Tirmania nivea]